MGALASEHAAETAALLVTWEWVTPVAYIALLVQEAFGGAPDWFALIVLGAFCWDLVRDLSS